MSRPKLALLSAAAAVLLATLPAAAAEYVFTVPVDVRNLHPTVTTGIVLCGVRNARGTYIRDPVSQSFHLTGGTFTGSVEIHATTPARGETAVSWLCTLRFVVPPRGPDLSAQTLSNPTHPNFHEEFRRAPGSEFRYEITGTF